MDDLLQCGHKDCQGGYKTLYIPVMTMPYIGGGSDKYQVMCDTMVVCALCAIQLDPMATISISDWELLVNKLLQDGLDVPDRTRAKLIFKPIK